MNNQNNTTSQNNLPVYRANSFEHSLTIQRETEHLEMVLMHLPDIEHAGKQADTFSVATVSNDNLDNEPERHIIMSKEEARLLRDLLNKLSEEGWLEE